MKKIIKTIIVLGLLLVLNFNIAFAFGDIIPVTPIEITPPANRIVDYSILFEPDYITVKLNFYNAGNNIVSERMCTISGTDYTNLMNATIQAGQLGQKYSTIMFKAIRNKCKDILNITGTVN